MKLWNNSRRERVMRYTLVAFLFCVAYMGYWSYPLLKVSRLPSDVRYWRIMRTIERGRRDLVARSTLLPTTVYFKMDDGPPVMFCKLVDDPALLLQSMSFPPLRKWHLDCSHQPYWPFPIYKH